MKRVVKVASPAAIAVLRQATALWPKRKRLSDGLLPSLAHQKQNPNSDHNTGLAADLTHDPKNGVDCGEFFLRLQSDARVDYLIFNSRIWSNDKGNRPYSGHNKHEKHLHISIKAKYAKDTSPWFGWMGEPKAIGKVKAKLIKPKAKKEIPSPKED